MKFVISNPTEKNIPPKAYIQNRSHWCWAATAKMVGQHYKILKPIYHFTIEKSSGLTFELRRQGFVSPQEMQAGVLTLDGDGLNFPCVREGQYYVDAWQRAIVMNANTTCRGKDGNLEGDDESKCNALKYVISGNIHGLGLHVANLGHVNEDICLLDQYRREIEEAFDSDKWMIGNYISDLTQSPHSVTLMAHEDGKIRLFDPWDGFSDVYTKDQIFRTGFLTSLGKGLVKWIQFVQ